MKKPAANPFAKLTVKDMVAAFGEKPKGYAPYIKLPALEHFFGSILRPLKQDGDIKPFQKAIRNGKAISVMWLINDPRFFHSMDKEKIRKAYNGKNDSLKAILDKDIRRINGGDRTVLEYAFPDKGYYSGRILLERIYAAGIIIEQSGVAVPTTAQILRHLDAATAEVVRRAVVLLREDPNARRSLSRHIANAARKRRRSLDA